MILPLHPLIAYFPIVLTFILPVLVVVFAVLIKRNKLTPMGWLIILGLQLTTTVTGYISLETGETDGKAVSKVLEHKLIDQHEESAEIFVGSTVLALVMGIVVFFIRYEYQFSIRMIIALMGLVSCYLAWNTAQQGGALVYTHGAAEAFVKADAEADADADEDEGMPVGILPTPGMNTSESPVSGEEDNDSLAPDENDYGSSEEPEVDEEIKTED